MDNPLAKMNTGTWTKEEHDLFLQGLDQFGKDWDRIKETIPTRTVSQVRTHAQKYYSKLEKDEKKNQLYGQSLTEEERNTSCCLRKHKRVDYLKLSGEVCDDNVSLSTIHPRRRNHKVSHTDQYLQRIQKEVSSYRHHDKTCGLESSPQINQMSRQMLSYTGPICYSYQNTIPVMLLPSGSLQPVMFVTPGFQPVMYPVPYPAFPQGAVMPGQTEESIPLAQSGDSFTMLPTVKMEGCSKLSQSVLPSDAYSSGSCTLPSYSAVDSRSDS